MTPIEETKLPWHAPKVVKAEINLDTAYTSGSTTDGNSTGNLPSSLGSNQ